MAAGMEGAGRDRSIGVNIRLPFEQGANTFIAQDPKLVEMRYFFTRKLMLIKESDGYVVLPGGFGTLDEGFELLTLLQTGKAEPAPVVMLDVPGGTYWAAGTSSSDEVEPRGLVSADDRSLFLITDDVGRATAEILGFYRNYHSCRWVGDLLVIRMHAAPGPGRAGRAQPAVRRHRGRGAPCGCPSPSRPNGPTSDQLDLARLVFRFDKVHYGRLRQLIDALNRLPVPPTSPRLRARPRRGPVDRAPSTTSGRRRGPAEAGPARSVAAFSTDRRARVIRFSSAVSSGSGSPPARTASVASRSRSRARSASSSPMAGQALGDVGRVGGHRAQRAALISTSTTSRSPSA